VSLFGSLGTLEKNGRVWAEFVNHLAAGATRRAGHPLIVRDGDGANLHSRAELRNRRENGGSLGAIGHAVGSVLHVTSHKDVAAGGQDRRANPKPGIRRVGVLHDFLRSLQEFFSHIRGQRLLGHRSEVMR